MKKITQKYLLTTLFVLVFPLVAFAQSGGTINPSGSGGTINPSNPSKVIDIPNPTNAGDDVLKVLTTVLQKVVMPIAAVAVTLWIFWAGFTFLMAQGKPAEIQKAQQRLLWSLIGAGILLGAAGISEVVRKTVELLTKP